MLGVNRSRKLSSHASSLDSKGLLTPFLVLDRAKMNANIANMNRCIADQNTTLRVHLKTAKCYEVARRAMATAQGPAAVSTLLEAEVFGSMGITDCLYTVSITSEKLEKVVALRKAGTDLKIVIDSLEAARMVNSYARKYRERLPTLVEIDVDGHRAGVAHNNHELLSRICNEISEAADFAGILAHAGESYHETGDTLTRSSKLERHRTAAVARGLATGGFPCRIVSVGSTPTAIASSAVDGVTEVRAGVYVFFDLFQAGIGVCDVSDIAVSVVGTVIGHQSEKQWTIVDAGWTALSCDRSTATQSVDQYFGVVCSIEGEPFTDWIVLKANQEQSILAPRPNSSCTVPQMPVGSRIRILPNHACATAGQHEEYKVVDGTTELVSVWSRVHGW